jgi:hypothetical protein
MMKLSAGLFAAALVVGLGSVPTLTYAEDDATEGASSGAVDPGADATTGESKLKKLEEEVVKDLEEDKDVPAGTLMDSEGADD